MKWFDKWFAKKCRWVWENHNEILNDTKGVPPTVYATSVDNRHRLNKDYVDFKLWFADNGGYVVEFTKYDHRKDRNENQIYIIPDGADKLGEEITQIITQYVMANR